MPVDIIYNPYKQIWTSLENKSAFDSDIYCELAFAFQKAWTIADQIEYDGILPLFDMVATPYPEPGDQVDPAPKTWQNSIALFLAILWTLIGPHAASVHYPGDSGVTYYWGEPGTDEPPSGELPEPLVLPDDFWGLFNANDLLVWAFGGAVPAAIKSLETYKYVIETLRAAIDKMQFLYTRETTARITAAWERETRHLDATGGSGFYKAAADGSRKKYMFFCNMDGGPPRGTYNAASMFGANYNVVTDPWSCVEGEEEPYVFCGFAQQTFTPHMPIPYSTGDVAGVSAWEATTIVNGVSVTSRHTGAGWSNKIHDFDNAFVVRKTSPKSTDIKFTLTADFAGTVNIRITIRGRFYLNNMVKNVQIILGDLNENIDCAIGVVPGTEGVEVDAYTFSVDRTVTVAAGANTGYLLFDVDATEIMDKRDYNPSIDASNGNTAAGLGSIAGRFMEFPGYCGPSGYADGAREIRVMRHDDPYQGVSFFLPITLSYDEETNTYFQDFDDDGVPLMDYNTGSDWFPPATIYPAAVLSESALGMCAPFSKQKKGTGDMISFYPPDPQTTDAVYNQDYRSQQSGFVHATLMVLE